MTSHPKTPLCAFCRTQKTLTKEHLFPKWLLERKKIEHGSDGSKRFLAKANKFVCGEPTIRDVCADCNNGSLSQLDQYFNEVYEGYISRYVKSGQLVKFTYDFDRLTRWLLKISYNHARVHKSPDEFILKRCSDYILYSRDKPLGLAVFLLLVTPYKIKEPNALRPELSNLKEFEPDLLRCAYGYLRSDSQQSVMIRLVQINSYLFVCLVPDQSSYKASKWNRDLKVFRERYPGMYRLRPNNKNTSKISMNLKSSINFFQFFEEYMLSENLDYIFDLIE